MKKTKEENLSNIIYSIVFVILSIALTFIISKLLLETGQWIVTSDKVSDVMKNYVSIIFQALGTFFPILIVIPTALIMNKLASKVKMTKSHNTFNGHIVAFITILYFLFYMILPFFLKSPEDVIPLGFVIFSAVIQALIILPMVYTTLRAYNNNK